MEETYGEMAVGLSFNPSELEEVAKIKKLYAEIIDLVNDMKARSEGEAARLLSIAITEAQTAQMRAVKGVTFWR